MFILFKKLPVLILIAFGFSKNSLLSLLFQSRVERWEENQGTIPGKVVKYEYSL